MNDKSPISRFTFKSLAQEFNCSKWFLLQQMAKHPKLKELRQKMGKRRILMKSEVELIREVLDYNESLVEFKNEHSNEK